MKDWYSPEEREYYACGSMYVSMANYGLTFSKGLTKHLINIASPYFTPLNYIKIGYDEDNKQIVFQTCEEKALGVKINNHGYFRIASRGLMRFIAEKTGINIDCKAKRYRVYYNKERGLFFIDINISSLKEK